MLKLLHQNRFAHGVHPPELKEETAGLAIHQLPFANLLIVPLLQHIGRSAFPVVAEGQEVRRGQLIARPDGKMSVAIHAPASGVVRRIALSPTSNGRMEPAFFLEPFPASTQEVVAANAVCKHETASPEEILSAIQNAGIVGLGGAAFPTHAKLSIPTDRSVDTVLINGAECEPYLTVDHRIMLERTRDVLSGIQYVLRATRAQRAVIAIEDNKADAADAIRNAISDDPISVEVLPVKYPQGAEKMLVKAVLGREIPEKGLPLDVATVCVNVGTTAELGKLLPLGHGLQERVITVSGPAVERKGNYCVPVGTTLRFILETVGITDEISSVIMGGPMMGTAVSSLDVPITKGSTGVIALTGPQTESMIGRREYPCIHCGYCVDACPLFLNPSRLGQLAGKARYEAMASEQHLMSCFECGCCAYVCPSHIPLVQRFRVAKRALRKKGSG